MFANWMYLFCSLWDCRANSTARPEDATTDEHLIGSEPLDSFGAAWWHYGSSSRGCTCIIVLPFSAEYWLGYRTLQKDKRREMEYSKIHTLRLMLAQEKKTRDALNASNASHKEDISRSDAKIKKLQEQLKQVCGEVSADCLNLITYEEGIHFCVVVFITILVEK